MNPKAQLHVGIQSCVKTEYTKHVNCPTTLYTNHHFMFHLVETPGIEPGSNTLRNSNRPQAWLFCFIALERGYAA